MTEFSLCMCIGRTHLWSILYYFRPHTFTYIPHYLKSRKLSYYPNYLPSLNQCSFQASERLFCHSKVYRLTMVTKVIIVFTRIRFTNILFCLKTHHTYLKIFKERDLIQGWNSSKQLCKGNRQTFCHLRNLLSKPNVKFLKITFFASANLSFDTKAVGKVFIQTLWRGKTKFHGLLPSAITNNSVIQILIFFSSTQLPWHHFGF